MFVRKTVSAERSKGWIGRREASVESERTQSASRFRLFSLAEDRDAKGEEVDEDEDVIGFLGSDGVLYCSKACALRRGSFTGYAVDQEEYESLVEGESLAAGGLCPTCGAEFAVSWPEGEPN